MTQPPAKRFVQALLFLLGVGLITAGILRGEALEIFNRTTVICLECIGIG
ncbi:MAG: hypothetical protein FWC16_06915 [Defluviitaleaceae bacterium]|nr:hypothetical protein [Defluviitaleaceae bacterium]MCL2274642.1 hypothetical protein [Defluviitaleaceae bacterium]